jgi:chromosome segregation ATPase
LQKQLQDNAHLVDNDEDGFRRHMAEVEVLKEQLKEVTDELEEYKKYGDVSSKVDLDREIQNKVQIYKNKLQSTYQQIDEWKHKAKNTEQRVESLQKQIRILENKTANQENYSNSGEDEAILKFRELFDIPDEADVFKEIEKIREEVEMVNLLKEELEKAQKINKTLEDKHQKLLNKKSKSEMNEYSQELLNAKNEEIERLN